MRPIDKSADAVAFVPQFKCGSMLEVGDTLVVGDIELPDRMTNEQLEQFLEQHSLCGELIGRTDDEVTIKHAIGTTSTHTLRMVIAIEKQLKTREAFVAKLGHVAREMFELEGGE